jgi:hypothetical protein
LLHSGGGGRPSAAPSNADEILGVLDELQTGGLRACDWQRSEETLARRMKDSAGRKALNQRKGRERCCKHCW